MAKVTEAHHNDGGAMSPEELQKAIEAYKARKAERSAGKEEAPTADDEAVNAPAEEEKSEPAPEKSEADGEEETAVEEPVADEPTEDEPAGSTPQDIAQMVKDRRDRRDSEEDPDDVEGAMGVIAQQDEDIDMLLACLEKFFQEEKAEGNHDGDEPDDANADGEGCEEENKDGEDEEKNEDSSDDKSKSLNADSADEIFRQRLSICRMGDKLHMDGLENKSIADGKKAIIKKVYPDMRLDGKSRAYIDAAYDLAVNEAGKRKDVNYQKKQMTKTPVPQNRTDGKEQSMAASARQRMIEREGGNA